MQDIGNVLEKARNEKQLSLEQASRYFPASRILSVFYETMQNIWD